MHFYVILASLILNANCIWPPEYEVNLKDEEEFIISETIDQSEIQDVYDEEEMIQKEDLQTLKLHENLNSEKYFKLHKQAKRENIEIGNKLQKFPKKDDNKEKIFTEFNPEQEESKPWIAGVVDENNNLKKDVEIIYFDQEAKSNKTNSEKVQKRNATSDVDYNYANLKAEFDKEVKKEETKNDTLKYKEVKEEESPQEAVETLADFNPRNCTEEEKSGLGFSAVKCFWLEARHKSLNRDKKTFILKKILLIIIIWISVYLAIALPLWCQYGWCCCCCRCKFCQPRNQIDEIKTFFANNPPGVYHDKDGTLMKYKPTTYEIYAYKKLEKGIQRL